MDITHLIHELRRFRDERDWAQFHTPKNLAVALSIETGEVQELLLWKTDEEVLDFVQSVKGHKRLEEEIADVLIYALLLASEVRVDPIQAIQRKIIQNAKKYPVHLAKGNAAKYSELRELQDKKGETGSDKASDENEKAGFPPQKQFRLFFE